MLFMNNYDIQSALNRHVDHPVLSRATRFLARLEEETDQHSDGWIYWPLPARAAKGLMTLIQSGDATEAQYKKALSPIKAFYTRRGYSAGMKWPDAE